MVVEAQGTVTPWFFVEGVCYVIHHRFELQHDGFHQFFFVMSTDALRIPKDPPMEGFEPSRGPGPQNSHFLKGAGFLGTIVYLPTWLIDFNGNLVGN